MQAGRAIPPASTDIELSHIRAEEQSLTTDAIMYPDLSRWKTFTIITTVTGITILNSMGNGIVTVGLPTIGRDLQLSDSLILWSPIHRVFLTEGPPLSIRSHAAASSSSQAN